MLEREEQCPACSDFQRASDTGFAGLSGTGHHTSKCSLAALQAEVAGIKCKLPNTISVQYPQYGVFNKDVYTAAAMGAYAGDVAASRSTVGCGC